MSSVMRRIVPGQLPTRDLHQFLLGVVSPRPIAFVSTVNEHGQYNLAPYSFFNAFSSNPPIVVFSSNRRVTDNTTKDTLANVRTSGECVINMVNYDIVRQMAVASVEFPSNVDEFEQSGLTPVPSEMVRPPRVAESPASLECRVKDIITLGEHGGAGHLVICEVVCMHIAESVIDEKGRIDPHKIDLMGRMGRSFYVRASGAAVMPIVQEVTQMVIGFQALPASVRQSEVLTGNELGRLAGLKSIPTDEEILSVVHSTPEIRKAESAEQPRAALHLLVRQALSENKLDLAAALAWYSDRV